MWHLKDIPKIIYLYWGKNRPLSYMRYMTVYSLSVLNPDWIIKVYYPSKTCKKETWQSQEQKYKPYNGIDFFPEFQKLPNVKLRKFDFKLQLGVSNDRPEVLKSDLLRLYLLANQGGIWSDTDIIYIKPIEQFCFNYENSDINAVCCYREPAVHVYNSIGLLMAGGNGKLLFSDLFFWALEKYEVSKSYQGLGSELYNDYFKLCNIFPQVKSLNDIEEPHRDNGIILGNLPYHAVYLNRKRGLRHFYSVMGFKIEEQRIGIHWYSGHEISARWENLITAQNIDQHERFFLSKLMQRVKNDKIQYPHTLPQESRASA